MSKKTNFIYAADSIVPHSVMSPTPISSVPKITNARPTGSSLLVEMLTPQEALGTILTINEDMESAVGSHQGYVRAVGAGLGEHHGIKVGDRVLLQGTCVPLPKFDNGRRKVIVDYHNIKAVLEEAQST